MRGFYTAGRDVSDLDDCVRCGHTLFDGRCDKKARFGRCTTCGDQPCQRDRGDTTYNGVASESWLHRLNPFTSAGSRPDHDDDDD
jgi:hypothetical protein